SATRRSPASPRVTTCARASAPCWSPSDCTTRANAARTRACSTRRWAPPICRTRRSTGCASCSPTSAPSPRWSGGSRRSPTRPCPHSRTRSWPTPPRNASRSWPSRPRSARTEERRAMRTVSGATDRVVVVGAGLAGLSAALHLTGAGRQVTVLERAPRPGGRVDTETLGGHAVDTGATVLTMPELLDEAFAAVGEKTSERLTLTQLDPAYRAHFADGSSIALHSDPEAMAAELRAVAGPREAQGYLRLRRWLTELYAAEAERFIGGNFDGPLDLVRPEALPQLARLVRLGGFGRLWPKVAR